MKRALRIHAASSLSFILSALWAGAGATQSPGRSVATFEPAAGRQLQVETGLVPRSASASGNPRAYTIQERMTHYSVTGVSVAVIRGGRIDWAQGYGLLEAGGTDSVSAATLFQAASISKPVAAVAALRLVEQGLLTLDGEVNGQLSSWRIPANPHTRSHPVTLRGLLSHTAGLTVHGFPGYPAGANVPSLVEILEGAGNTAPVVVTYAPGTAARYSGGGYTVAQVLIEDVTGEPFAAVAEREVLRPLAMERSTFAQPLPATRNGEAAVAHGRRGLPTRGRWHTYPEQAAAGLWTTPADLARFLIALRSARSDDEDAILRPESIEAMLTRGVPTGPGYGLGIGVFDNGGGLQVEHGGANHGYRSLMRMYLESGDGVVIMTNADDDGELRMEILRAVARVYRWPDRL